MSSCLDLSGAARHCSTVVGILPLSAGNLGSESQVVIASFKRCLDSNQADGTVPVWLEPSWPTNARLQFRRSSHPHDLPQAHRCLLPQCPRLRSLPLLPRHLHPHPYPRSVRVVAGQAAHCQLSAGVLQLTAIAVVAAGAGPSVAQMLVFLLGRSSHAWSRLAAYRKVQILNGTGVCGKAQS